MGSRGQYESSSRFSNYFEPQYHAVDNISGVKVLQKNGSAIGNGALPEYAKTSEAYVNVDRLGRCMRLRIYKNHKPLIDIDLGHPNHHGLRDGDVHVHRYGTDAQGHPVRSQKSRCMLKSEHEKYDKILNEMIRRNKQ